MASYILYAIDRDHGDGRTHRRYAFEPLGRESINYADSRGLVTHNDTDGGEAGTLTAPDGSRLDGDTLILPNWTQLTADEARAAARDLPHLRMGLSLAD